MNNIVSSKRTSHVLLGVFILVLFLALYYYLLFPKKTEIAMKETALLSIDADIQSLQAQIEASSWNGQSAESDFILLKKLPLSRELDQIILSIEEIELISDSQIQSVTFNNYDEILLDSELAQSTQQTEETQNETTDGTVTADSELVTDPVSQLDVTSLPPDLKLITFNINVSTKNYEQLKIFIGELEQLERVFKIEGVNFTLPGEVEFASEEDIDLAINADILLTTFYYDGIFE